MKASRGHGPAARLSIKHQRFLRNAAKPKRKNRPRSPGSMRIANALGIRRNGKRSRKSSSNKNPRPSPPPVSKLLPSFDFSSSPETINVSITNFVFFSNSAFELL